MQGCIINTPALSVYEHMAFDELKAASSGDDGFVIRFYNWDTHSVTFGYAQNCDYVIKTLPDKFKNAPIVRRPTGGGIVFHDTDITFSCIFPDKSMLRPVQIYSKIHKAVYEGLLSRKINCTPSVEEKDYNYKPNLENTSAQCFTNPVKFDLIDEGGNKILGGAIRKFKDIVLYQGSLRVLGAREKQPELELAIIKALAQVWQIKWQRKNASAQFLKEVKLLAENKYKTAKWFEKL